MKELNLGGVGDKLTEFLGFLNSVKVSARIGILSALGVVSIAILGSAYVIGDISIRAASVERMENTKLAQLSMAVEVGALQMRRNEKDFLMRKDMKYVERYEQSALNVLDALEEMKSLAAAADVQAEITAIEEGIADHVGQFRSVVSLTQQLGIDETQGLQGALRASVHAVETKLKEVNLAELTVKMLMMRRHEKDFMLRGAEKYIGRIDERRAEFDALLQEAAAPRVTTAPAPAPVPVVADAPVAVDSGDASSDPASLDAPQVTAAPTPVVTAVPLAPLVSDEFVRDVSKLMDQYQAGIRRYADFSMNAAGEIKKLSEIFADMVPAFERTAEVAASGLENAEKSLEASKSTTETIYLIVGLLVLGVVSVFGFAVGRSITDSLKQITSTMSSLADGDLDTNIPYRDNKHEIGEMARAVEVFRGNAVEREKLEAEQAERQAAREERTKRMEELISAFDAKSTALLGAVSASSGELHDTAGQMTQTAEATSSRASAASSAADAASANVQTVAAAAEELHSAIEEIGRQVVQSTEISRQTTSAAEKTSETMGHLAEAADKIGAVISLIQDIAEQTNLLALNATIEAARAGEAGKGFAVVAGEVKSLANQTAKATDEISLQISTMQESTKDAVGAIDQVNGMIAQMSEIATAISSAVEEQGAATQEIAGSVQEAARGTSEVTSNISEVDAVTGESTETAKKVNNFASDLSAKSDELRQEVEVFLESVKAA